VVTLLRSLTQSYSTIVTALEAHVDDNLKLTHFQQALINKEIKIAGRLEQYTNTKEQNSSAITRCLREISSGTEMLFL